MNTTPPSTPEAGGSGGATSASEAGGWTAICTVDELPVLGARRVQRPHGLDVAVFRAADDTVFALLDRCPHKGGPLSQGIVFGHSVACPLHNWTIGLASGQAAAPDEGCTPRFAVRVVDGVVHLSQPELDHLATDLERPVAGPARRTTACATTPQGHGCGG